MIVNSGVGFRRELRGFEKVRERVFRLAQLEKNPAKAGQISRVLWFEFHGFLDETARLLKLFTMLDPHVAKIVERLSEVRCGIERFLEVFLGLLVIATAFE